MLDPVLRGLHHSHVFPNGKERRRPEVHLDVLLRDGQFHDQPNDLRGVPDVQAEEPQVAMHAFGPNPGSFLLHLLGFIIPKA